MTRIYAKIAQDSCGVVDVENYAAFMRTELTRLYPDADIEIETTTRESGVMPEVIEAETWEEQEEIGREMSSLWNRYGDQF